MPMQQIVEASHWVSRAQAIAAKVYTESSREEDETEASMENDGRGSPSDGHETRFLCSEYMRIRAPALCKSITQGTRISRARNIG